jgi:diketogulonate reductase-like aldo/keto reductase/cephalosporin hydroxylase
MLLVFLVLLIAPGLAHAAAGTSVQVAAADSAANPGNPAGNPANPAATALPRLLRYDATVDGAHVFVDFSCQDSAAALAEMFCDDHSVQPHARCVLQTYTEIARAQAKGCPFYMEDWLDRPMRDWLEVLQWRILDKSEYDGVTTWKFPFDLWMYRELLAEQLPTVLVEVGNYAGGSALFYADLYDTLGHAEGRIIAVDIDHSMLHEKARSHPRITWIEDDAARAFSRVRELIDPVHDKVMVIEDASHEQARTLDIMRTYGSLVTNGSYMIIEDTVLHNGVRNDFFEDPGAFAAVKEFMASPEHACGWRIDRDRERFVVTWNPRGFLQKVAPHGACADSEPGDKSSAAEAAWAKHRRQLLHNRWHNAPLDTERFLRSLGSTRRFVAGVHVMLSVDLMIHGPGGNVAKFVPIPVGRQDATAAEILQRAKAACKRMFESPTSKLVGDQLDLCGATLLARAFFVLPESAREGKDGYSRRPGRTAALATQIPMHAWEVDTPLHVYPSSSASGDRQGMRTSVKDAVRTTGIAVVGSLLADAAVLRLRNAIILHTEYTANAASPPHRRTRYLDPLCAFGAEDCRAWDEGFLDLVRHPAVLKHVEALIGDDCLVDSTSISIQWPGESLFGPHVDRPFVSSDNTKDSWPYSARAATAQPVEASRTGTGAGLGLPPMDYPISVQVLWLLDNFTSANGAFFYLPPNPRGLRGSAARNTRPFPQARQGMFPPTPDTQMVTGLAGSAIIAHGSVWHGAAPNLFSRPRLAFLVQFVPKFVRPGNRYPFGMLGDGMKRLGLDRGAQARLVTLFDATVHVRRQRSKLEFQGADGETRHMPYDVVDDVLLGDAFQDRVRSRLEAVAPGMSKDALRASVAETVKNVRKDALLNYDVCHAPSARVRRGDGDGGGANVVQECTSQAVASEIGYFTMEATNSAATEVTAATGDWDVAMGTASLGSAQIPVLLRAALVSGIRHFDMAEMYGNQKWIGQFFQGVWGGEGGGAGGGGAGADAGLSLKRSDVFFTSKIWCTNLAPAHVRASLEQTLGDLQIDYLDQWLIHWPVALAHTGVSGPAQGAWMPVDEASGQAVFARGYSLCDTWAEMERAHADGLVRSLGVSNFSPAVLHQILGCAKSVRPTVNQVEAHPYFAQDALLRYCRANNITLQAYSPLAAGAAGGTRDLLREPALVIAARAHGTTPAHVALRWNVQRGVPVVTQSSRPGRVAGVLAGVRGFALTSEEVAAIDAVAQRAKFVVPDAFRFLL